MENQQNSENIFTNDQSNKNQSSKHNDHAIALILADLLKEQRRSRRNDTIFRVINLFLIFIIPLVIFAFIIVTIIGSISAVENSTITDDVFNSSANSDTKVPHTALIEITGVIGEGMVDPDKIIETINRAFKNSQAKGVILKINSPGGSPTISDNLYTGIKAVRVKYPQKPFMVVTGDVCASGGYYIAVVGDKIFVNQSSIVGSIGVIHMGFGMKSLLEKVGVTPRIITAGERKAVLNPFEDLKAEDKEHLQKVLGNIHKRFIEVVKEGRGTRLMSENLYNGLFWSGEEAVSLGLADGIASVSEVAKKEIGEEHIVKYSLKRFDLESFLSSQIQTFFNNSFFTLTNLKIQ